MFKQKKKGFTIVELVIVIAIIAILSAILIPTFSGLVSETSETAMNANFGNAYKEYCIKNCERENVLSKEEVYFASNGVLYKYENKTYIQLVIDETVVTEDNAESFDIVPIDVYNSFMAYYYVSGDSTSSEPQTPVSPVASEEVPTAEIEAAWTEYGIDDDIDDYIFVIEVGDKIVAYNASAKLYDIETQADLEMLDLELRFTASNGFMIYSY